MAWEIKHKGAIDPILLKIRKIAVAESVSGSLGMARTEVVNHVIQHHLFNPYVCSCEALRARNKKRRNH
jgi:hypothetical protein